MEKQIEKAKNLDALIVLGGEGRGYRRSNHAANLYKEVEKMRENPLNIVLTGYHSGLSSNIPEKAESEIMRDYLISCGISQEVIFNENKSRDNLAGIIYIQPILKEINAKKLGIVTDRYHMNRVLWTANRVLGTGYEMHAFPTNKKTGLFVNLTEKAVKYAQAFDLFMAGIKSGDQEAFEKYLIEKHPFHAPTNGNKAPFGAYKAGIYLMNILKIKRKLGLR